ncbi:MAG: hypothetical protein J07AB43_02980 [Candidatus Nanosalina sp. J07AB43]|jgi:hypothetical protein|nr:MAG: hypothetical protein J07AB43_02980 [Candidatus Nanosalina sp. J07AB43]
MEFEDLPPQARQAFYEVGREYAAASVDPETQRKYVQGLNASIRSSEYARGLSEKFNIPMRAFFGVESKWADSLNAEDYVIGMAEVDFDEEISQRYAEAITD